MKNIRSINSELTSTKAYAHQLHAQSKDITTLMHIVVATTTMMMTARGLSTQHSYDSLL